MNDITETIARLRKLEKRVDHFDHMAIKALYYVEARNALPSLLECLEEAFKIILIERAMPDEIESLKKDFKKKWGLNENKSTSN